MMINEFEAKFVGTWKYEKKEGPFYRMFDPQPLYRIYKQTKTFTHYKSTRYWEGEYYGYGESSSAYNLKTMKKMNIKENIGFPMVILCGQ